ncbi:hypothetical protein C8Q73DRAFT_279294 [Cubamyces lactineus]|nr:hypothetical protein C8Q73DRAFT_279294 [Cubamyces lactineus]
MGGCDAVRAGHNTAFSTKNRRSGSSVVRSILRVLSGITCSISSLESVMGGSRELVVARGTRRGRRLPLPGHTARVCAREWPCNHSFVQAITTCLFRRGVSKWCIQCHVGLGTVVLAAQTRSADDDPRRHMQDGHRRAARPQGYTYSTRIAQQGAVHDLLLRLRCDWPRDRRAARRLARLQSLAACPELELPSNQLPVLTNF